MEIIECITPENLALLNMLTNRLVMVTEPTILLQT